MMSNIDSMRYGYHQHGGIRPLMYLVLLLLSSSLLLPEASAFRNTEKARYWDHSSNPYHTERGKSNSRMRQRLIPQTRLYEVAAIPMPIVFNAWGDYDPKGLMFTLEQNLEYLSGLREHVLDLVSQNSTELPMDSLVKPLVLRCNKGDKMYIKFKNYIEGSQVGLHPHIGEYDIDDDGTAVGSNSNILSSFGEEKEYTWPCIHEGTFMISDGGDYDGSDDGTIVHGLFGAIIVEPRGSLWTDPTTGEPTVDGIHVDIHPYPLHGGCPKKDNYYEEDPKYSHPDCPFREFSLFFQDKVGIQNKRPPTADPCKGPDQTGIPRINIFNYRSEPMKNRELALWRKINEGLITDVNGEEQHHSSWLFGDPATPIFRAYAGDPVKYRVIDTGITETHVFHLHGHQWSSGRGDRESTIVDSFSLSPLTTWYVDIHYGAGSRLKTIGDVILHCHLYAHFATGMWSIMRVIDRYEDGTDTYPDGSPIPRLIPLPGRPHPPLKNERQPGFPNFIAGTPGQKSPRVPWPVELFGEIPEGSDYRPATEIEIASMNSDPQIGNTFTLIPTPREVTSHFFNVSIMTRSVEYNKYGWYYPHGHMYAPVEKVQPDPGHPARYDPFTMRVTQKSVAVSQYNNNLPQVINATAFDAQFPRCEAVAHEGEAGMHVHLVKFDVLSSDGASVGWNFISGARYGKYLVNRWWIDDALGHVFFHDHLFANFRQKKGLYGIAPVSPEGSKFYDTVEAKKEQRYTPSAIVVTPKESFREQVLFIGDFTPAFYANGTAIHPPIRNELQDQGIVVMNYRNEPLVERKGLDPSEWFSSKNQYGDPSTTLFEAYRGDNIIVRLVQGAHDKPHSFEMHGMRWQKFNDISKVNVTSQQTIGVSEGFTFRIQADYSAGDHIYKLGGIDDLWIGNWGITRVYDKPQKHLAKIPGSGDMVSSFYHSSSLKNIAQNRYSNTRTSARETSKYKTRVSDVRKYFLTAKRQEIVYNSDGWSDPYGLIYCLTGYQEPHSPEVIKPEQGECFNVQDDKVDPLIIRGLVGERILLYLHNGLPKHMSPEPFPIPVPADDPHLRASNRVSIHAPLIQHDVRYDDGSNVGRNPDSTVGPGETRVYSWFADQHLGALPLQDHADVRNHKHHGIIGALVILDSHHVPDRWYGAEANIHRRSQCGLGELIYQDKVVILQSGLRLFQNNELKAPIPYANKSPYQILSNFTAPVLGEQGIDFQDAGLKAMNYRTQPASRPSWLQNDQPSTTVFHSQANAHQVLNVVSGLDKPRALSFHLHGHTWMDQLKSPELGYSSVNNALSTGSTVANSFVASNSTGDWAYRTGSLNAEYLIESWGIFRVSAEL
ncbi:hypothetical protein K7432_005044 [Basidiobolus ranarum]|uniref:Plastocyanin-like domain-containing protein n=1 Tax=Basidiobolus ranarum TaxID=34480 RepID=A0ABR2WXB2_9FUNG